MPGAAQRWGLCEGCLGPLQRPAWPCRSHLTGLPLLPLLPLLSTDGPPDGLLAVCTIRLPNTPPDKLVPLDYIFAIGPMGGGRLGSHAGTSAGRGPAKLKALSLAMPCRNATPCRCACAAAHQML